MSARDKSAHQGGPKLTPAEFFSKKDVFTVKHLALMAVLLAIRFVLNLPFLTIYITPHFKLITFSYLANATVAMLFGPIAGLLFAFAGDTLGFFASFGTGGAYFPGFALSEMTTTFIFALFFFKRRITWQRVTIAWILNLAIVLLGMNCLWLILVYGESAGMVFTAARFISNTAQSPVHIVLLYFILRKINSIQPRISNREQSR
jgi:ECF transporter S component (folate family)